MHRNSTTTSYRANAMIVALAAVLWVTGFVFVILSELDSDADLGRIGVFSGLLATVLTVDFMLRRERARVETIADIVQLAARLEERHGVSSPSTKDF